MATQSLPTGNAKARKAGKVATYAVTQETFDLAFNVGRSFAGAYASAGEALQPLLAPLSGLSTDAAIAQWREYRRAFCLGMAAERNIVPGSSERAWQRIVDDLGLDKPQSVEAKRKAASRAKAKPAAQPATGEADDASPMDGAGEAAAQAVQMALSSMEAHIITLLRAGKVSMATQAIADSYAA